MKTFKKADTFGERSNWQISEEDRKKIIEAFNKQSNEGIYDEALDDLIVVLEKLGYVKIE